VTIPTTPQPSEPRLLDVDAVARELHLSTYTTAAWMRSGRLPGIRIGRAWHVRPADLDAWLSSQVASETADNRCEASA